MAMQPDRPAEVVGVVLGPEDAAAVCVEHAGVAELVDGPARLEGGIELEERLRPEQAAIHLFVHAGGHPRVGDPHETPGVVGVVGNDVLVE